MTVKVEKTTSAFFANKVRKALHKKIKGYSNCWVQDPIQLKGVPHFPIVSHILVLVKQKIVQL